LRRDFGPSRRIAVLVVGVSAAAFVTPYGFASALMTPRLLNMKLSGRIQEWSAPDFQSHPLHLAFVVGTFVVIAFFGIRLRGPRLLILVVISVLGLKYLRGLVMFSLLMPLILARPAAQRVRFLKAQDQSTVGPVDPVLTFLHRHAAVVPAVCLAIAVAAALSPMQLAGANPPGSVVPAAAMNFVKQADIKGNVFNSYGFGGYMIFLSIPTFIDGRTQLFDDAFLERYFRAISLVDIEDAFQLLNDYKVDWAILPPGAPFAKAMARSPDWNKAYSDRYAVVLVRRHTDGADNPGALN
jgi:hypothetical protein